MTSIMFVLAGVLLVVGVLIGSGLHTRAIDRRRRRVAQLVRELHELAEALAEREEALAEREEALASSGDHRRISRAV
ncbi:MAG: hypothetical protein ACRDRP_05150 [Pseudonocardiaceae bacterium]